MKNWAIFIKWSDEHSDTEYVRGWTLERVLTELIKAEANSFDGVHVIACTFIVTE
jgi:hypothetical protein